VIGNAGDDLIAVLSVLADGLDVIVWTHGAAAFTPSVERGLAARLRTRETALITLVAGLCRPDYRLDAQIIDYHGINQGFGLLSDVDTVSPAAAAVFVRPAPRFVSNASTGLCRRRCYPTRSGCGLPPISVPVYAAWVEGSSGAGSFGFGASSRR